MKKLKKSYEHDIELENINLKNDKYNHCLELRVQGHLYHDGDEVGKIGASTIFIFDESWYDIIEASDMHSQESIDALSSLSFDRISIDDEHFENFINGNNIFEFNNYFSSKVKERDEANRGYVEAHGRVAVIDTFTIAKRFRTKGLGVSFMRELLPFLATRMCVNYVVLKAHPYLSDVPYPEGRGTELSPGQVNENNQFIERKKLELSNFYHNHFGFVHTGDPKLNHMVLDLEGMVELMDEEDAM